jgi:hypothetical protein
MGWLSSSNTPIREVIYLSPRNDKNIFIVESYLQEGLRLGSVFASAAFLKVDSHPVPIYANMANKYVKRDDNCNVLTINLNNVNMVI